MRFSRRWRDRAKRVRSDFHPNRLPPNGNCSYFLNWPASGPLGFTHPTLTSKFALTFCASSAHWRSEPPVSKVLIMRNRPTGATGVAVAGFVSGVVAKLVRLRARGQACPRYMRRRGRHTRPTTHLELFCGSRRLPGARRVRRAWRIFPESCGATVRTSAVARCGRSWFCRARGDRS